MPTSLRERVKSNSQLLFVLHVEPSNANPMQYPLPVEGERRGLGILLNMNELTYADDKQDKKVKIKPLNELLNAETWKK